MNPFKTPIRFWIADWRHERWLRKANIEARKKGYWIYFPPPSRELFKNVIFHQREK